MLLVVLVGTSALPSFSLPAVAACAGPTIDIAPSSGEPGSTVTVKGDAFASECRDTWVCVEGQPCTPPPPAPPYHDIAIVFVQGERTWRVSTVDASPSYGFMIQVVVPHDADLGPASIITEDPGSYPPRTFEVTSPGASPRPTPEPTDAASPTPAVTSTPAAPSPKTAATATGDTASTTSNLARALPIGVVALIVAGVLFAVIRRRRPEGS